MNMFWDRLAIALILLMGLGVGIYLGLYFVGWLGLI